MSENLFHKHFNTHLLHIDEYISGVINLLNCLFICSSGISISNCCGVRLLLNFYVFGMSIID